MLLLALCSQFWLRALPDKYPRNENVDISSYRFSLSLDDNSRGFEARAWIHFQALSSDVSSLTLDLIGRDGADSQSGMRVSAASIDGENAEFLHRADRLEISFPRPVRKGETGVILIEYGGTPGDGLIVSDNRYGQRTYFGDNWPDRARHWLPTIDHPYDKAICEFEVEADADFQVVANGRLIEEEDRPEGRRRTVWRSLAPLPTKVMVFGAARFAVEHLRSPSGLSVQSWVYPQDRQGGLPQFARAVGILDYFERTVAPFPYAKLANVQSSTRYGGMENAGAIFYREGVFDGAQEAGGRGVERLIAHEIAHQWFGDSVTESDWHHVWISEGFATYFSFLYLESRYGRERLLAELESALERIRGFASRRPGLSIVDESIQELDRLLNANSYQKGAWVLHMLRGLVGDEGFFRAVRAFYQRHRHGNALTGDFRRAVEEATGRDLGWFFDQWIYRPGFPKLEGEWDYDSATRSLRVSLRQAQGGRPFRLKLDLQAHLPGGEGHWRRSLELDAVQRTFQLPLAAEPDSVVLDPERWVLMDLEFQQKR